MLKRVELIYAFMKIDGKKIKVYPEHVEAAGRRWFFITGYDEISERSYDPAHQMAVYGHMGIIDEDIPMKENCREEHASFYREMDNDKLLEEVSRKFPGCPDDTCFACLDNKTLINELRRRMEGK